MSWKFHAFFKFYPNVVWCALSCCDLLPTDIFYIWKMLKPTTSFSTTVIQTELADVWLVPHQLGYSFELHFNFNPWLMTHQLEIKLVVFLAFDVLVCHCTQRHDFPGGTWKPNLIIFTMQTYIWQRWISYVLCIYGFWPLYSFFFNLIACLMSLRDISRRLYLCGPLW